MQDAESESDLNKMKEELNLQEGEQK